MIFCSIKKYYNVNMGLVEIYPNKLDFYQVAEGLKCISIEKGLK